MRGAVLLFTVMVGALVLLASGIALAAVVQCVAGATSCNGTEQADKITGTAGPDDIFAGGGDDNVVAGAGNDRITGDSDIGSHDGKDTILAGPGDDEFGAFGRSDTLRGGTGNDTIHAVDGVADDIDCGKGGSDRVDFDSGIDAISRCEIQMPR
jgi:Ca2+-binding RTX toxin-like protein